MKRKLKKKALIAICATLGVILIIGGGVFFFYQGYKSDVAKTNEQIKKIKKEYDPFKEAVLAFSTERETIFNEVFSHKYFMDVNTNYEAWIEHFKTYESTIEKVEESAKELINLCKYTYVDYEAKNKCEAFYILYEQSNNYFVKDIEEFEKFITEYNEWIDTLENGEYQKVEEFKAKKTYQYVDLNHDQIYTGKDIEG